MGSTNKTALVGLNQWIGSDILRREDFNYDKNILDKQVFQRNKVWRSDVTLYADQWVQSADRYVHAFRCTDKPGIRVDLSAAVPDLLAINTPIVLANINGELFAETVSPPGYNIRVQAAMTYVLGAGPVVYGRSVHNGSSGSAYPPDNVAGFYAENDGGRVLLRWEDPADTAVDHISLAVWAGTKIVRKTDAFPDTEHDGILVVDSKVRNEYREDGLADERLQKGGTYCYQAFPYSTTGAVNRYAANRVEITLE